MATAHDVISLGCNQVSTEYCGVETICVIPGTVNHLGRLLFQSLTHPLETLKLTSVSCVTEPGSHACKSFHVLIAPLQEVLCLKTTSQQLGGKKTVSLLLENPLHCNVINVHTMYVCCLGMSIPVTVFCLYGQYLISVVVDLTRGMCRSWVITMQAM